MWKLILKSETEGEAVGYRGDDGGRGGGDRPQGDGVVPGEPRGHVGHAVFHAAIREGAPVCVGEKGGRLLCMESLLHEADPHLDQHGVLGAEGGAGGRGRQVQVAVQVWEEGREGEVAMAVLLVL